MAAPERKRVFLGKAQELGARQRVYIRDDCVEVDELDYYEISRSRIFFEDIWAVTRHHMYGWMYLLTMGLGGGLLSLIALGILSSGEVPVAVVFFVLASPFTFLFCARVILGLDVVTVQGRRTRAAMHFFFRKRRAGEVFDLLTLKARSAQQKAQVVVTPPSSLLASEVPPTMGNQ